MAAPSPNPDNERRFFFIHIQKTAGTSLREHLFANFDRAEVYPPPPTGGLAEFLTFYLSGSLLVDAPACEQTKYRLFHGHMPYAVTQMLSFDTPPATLTVLREPIARTLSVLGQKKRHRPEFADATLEDIYDDRDTFEGQILNHQTKVFAVPTGSKLLSGFDPFPVGAKELELAKQNLSKVDVIGLQDDIPSFLNELQHKFSWVSLESDVRANVGKKREVSQTFLDRIAKDNEIEFEFYRYAVDLIKSRAQ